MLDTVGKHIFVFGSNLAGRHGAGAALHARLHYGAEYGVGRGRTGRSYAIPTKDEHMRTRSLDRIKRDVEVFVQHAANNPHLVFHVTRVHRAVQRGLAQPGLPRAPRHQGGPRGAAAHDHHRESAVKCPACSTDGAYVGFATVECANKTCRHFVASKTEPPQSDYQRIVQRIFVPMYFFMPKRNVVLVNL